MAAALGVMDEGPQHGDAGQETVLLSRHRTGQACGFENDRGDLLYYLFIYLFYFILFDILYDLLCKAIVQWNRYTVNGM